MAVCPGVRVAVLAASVTMRGRISCAQENVEDTRVTRPNCLPARGGSRPQITAWRSFPAAVGALGTEGTAGSSTRFGVTAVGVAVVIEVGSSSMETTPLNSRMAFPSERPISGRRFDPKMRSKTTRRTSSSGSETSNGTRR